jgi:hypothetical protein
MIFLAGDKSTSENMIINCNQKKYLLSQTEVCTFYDIISCKYMHCMIVAGTIQYSNLLLN